MPENPAASPSEPAPVALLSGSSAGLTYALAQRLHAQGTQVHVMSRNAKRRGELEREFGEGHAHGGDVTEPETAATVVRAVLERSGRLDIVVAGVGTYRSGPLAATPIEGFEELVQTNLFASVRLMDAARSALRQSQGRVLFFGAAGLPSLRARKETAAYTAAKTALLSYMRSLALEEAPHGVRINMLSPGVVPHAGAAPDTHDPEVWRSIPLGRPGSLEDIANGALWLLGADHVTGENLEVAGGFLL